ncbi:MAG: primosomal protein N' [Bacteroidales bacterium]|nr:primosomal protein N' [Bacteroidales bacterium]
MMKTYFVDVILPLHIHGTYTYRVPQEYNVAIAVGQRVVVQFGQRRLYAALVRRVHEEVPKYTVKYILSILDTEPIVGEQQLCFWEWIAAYYMCYVGDVMAVALPSMFRLASESSVAIHPDFTGELSDLSDNELRIVQLLTDHPVMTVEDISKAIGVQKMMPLLNTMIEREIIMMDEDMRQRFVPKTAIYVQLAEEYKDEARAKELFDRLEQKKTTQRQVDVMLKFMQMSHFGQDPVLKRTLLDSEGPEPLSDSAFKTLVKNGVLVLSEHVESRLERVDAENCVSADTIHLNEEQQAAFDYLRNSDKAVSLLHGVTSSGKTEVYIKLIDEVVKQGKQVLFLLPEIALTAQIINRLRRYFGDLVGVYHSRFSPSQRAEVWTRTFTDDPNQQFQVLLGARSALFLPFRNLGLVIVDEEHDTSYKQYDPTPRYHGRDAAIYLAHLWGARTVLGSATPSLESYFNAKQGKYGLVTMTKRYGGLQMPEVLCADMKEELRQIRREQGEKAAQSTHFSRFLLENMQEALDNHEQVILFQNRRGFSLRIECDDCHWTPQCQHCDVSLVYHKATNSMRCHYCGYSIPLPSECPACHSHHLTMKGFGTERIEDDLSILFPKARVARMDLDSTLQKNRYLEIINDFQDRKIDILVGTQMVTKGLDFDNVSVVGIVSADNLIYFPDFRAFERAFQQMTQVSGRAGRHGHQGKVIIQTFNPYHQAIRNVIDNDYAAMYDSQITERRVFRYPPFYRLITLTLKHRDSDRLNDAASILARDLRGVFAQRVIGPEYPNVSRVRGLYIKNIILRFERNEAVADAKRIILDLCDRLKAGPTPGTKDRLFATLQIHFDVDPQ